MRQFPMPAFPEVRLAAVGAGRESSSAALLPLGLLRVMDANSRSLGWVGAAEPCRLIGRERK